MPRNCSELKRRGGPDCGGEQADALHHRKSVRITNKGESVRAHSDMLVQGVYRASVAPSPADPSAPTAAPPPAPMLVVQRMDDEEDDADGVPISTASSFEAQCLIELVEHATKNRWTLVSLDTPVVHFLRKPIMDAQHEGFDRQDSVNDDRMPDATMELDVPCVIRGARGSSEDTPGMVALTSEGAIDLPDGARPVWESLRHAKRERLGTILSGESHSADACVGEPLRIAPSRVGLSEMCLLPVSPESAAGSPPSAIVYTPSSGGCSVQPWTDDGSAMLTFEGCENFVVEPGMLYGLSATHRAGKGLVRLLNCRNVTVESSVFVSYGAAYGLRIEGCKNVHVVGCSFFGCGISICGGFDKIQIHKCKFQALVGGQRHYSMHAPGALLSIEGPPGPPAQDDKRLVMVSSCDCKVRLCAESLLASSLRDGLASAVSPCFLSAQGSCTLDFRHVKVVGPIGSIGPSVVFDFHALITDVDWRLAPLCKEVTRLHEEGKLHDGPGDGILRTLYTESTQGTFKSCVFGVGTRIVSGSRPSGGAPATRVSRLTFKDCSFTLSKDSTEQASAPVVVQSPYTVVLFSGERTMVSTSRNTSKMLNTFAHHSDSGLLVYCPEGGCLVHFSTLLHLQASSGVLSLPDEVLLHIASVGLVSQGTKHRPVFMCFEGAGGVGGARGGREGQRVCSAMRVEAYGDGTLQEVRVSLFVNPRMEARIFVIRPEYSDALVRGMDLALQLQGHHHSGAREVAVHGIVTKDRQWYHHPSCDHPSCDTIVPWSVVLRGDTRLACAGDKKNRILPVASVLLRATRPLQLSLQGVHVHGMSPEEMAQQLFLFSPKVEYWPTCNGRNTMPKDPCSAAVRVPCGSVVCCTNCTFTLDLGWCTKASGVCVVQDASHTIMRSCTLRLTSPTRVIVDGAAQQAEAVAQGPGACLCYSPAGDRATRANLVGCHGIERDGQAAQGGCVAQVVGSSV